MKTLYAALVMAAVAAPALAQQPNAVNARVDVRPAPADLASAVKTLVAQQADPAWLGYTVPIFARDGMPRNDGWSERCRLEQTPAGMPNSTAVGPVKLEASPRLMVLMRIQNREIQRIRTLSDDCQVDAGNLPLVWMQNVDPAQSVAFLKTFVTTANLRGPAEQALNAIGLHRDASASSVLLDFAKSNPDAQVRRRALSSVARRAEMQAVPTLTEAIERDPDVEVKKQAVFALSQLPGGEGVRRLIELARSNSNPAVRKQAISLLGQSRDPQALAFLEQMLR